MYTTTQTATYTVTDVRKTFGNFEADLRMIARRTGKLTQTQVEEYCQDVLTWAEGYYLDRVDIVLTNSLGKVLQAARYTVNEAGSALSGDRAGGNDWPDVAGSSLNLVICPNATWQGLDATKKQALQEKMNINWGVSSIDTSYSHLQRSSAQGYASKGYELNKENFQ
ncbi:MULTISPECIES: HORMA-1 domain-containing protein [Hymenobacter]|jgi:hypothetical protein|uniref:Bacterial HORMA domain-containing protein n=2 Tax=Hymenobacter TaxID=89966 RepID=A0A4Z0MCZ6_9BACT|nr:MULTISPECIES: hypothetical protein [Hymenobacter]TGD77379.1 hypothetical protein EU557_23750 [Hymenobacter wooponensis]TGE03479.1 hypothetical protein EU556_25125 [Hymenobacter fodinae]